MQLQDQQYLIWGDNGLSKTPTIAIGTIGGLAYHRFAAVWKAQNTGAVNTVRIAWPKSYLKLKLIQNDNDPNFTSANSYTDMENVQVINGVEYYYADVTITNGQYFTIAAFLHAPGGVTRNLSYWYRADKQVNSDDGNSTQWIDFKSGVTSASINNAPSPQFSEGNVTHFNFNPTIQFTSTNQNLGNVQVQTLTSTDFDLFSSSKLSTNGVRIFNIGKDNTTFDAYNWDQPGLNADGKVYRRNVSNNSLAYYSAGPFPITPPTNIPSILHHSFTDNATTKELNGSPNFGLEYHSSMGQALGGHTFGANNTLGMPGGDDIGFIGDIGEMIIYGDGTGNVTSVERNKIESYLAIKYGLTLHNSNNYTTSTDAIVWDATANSAYYYNVAGIGFDFRSALDQKQSRSQLDNTNSQIVIGLGSIEDNMNDNLNSIPDGAFLIWGDNNNTQNMSNLASTYSLFE